jgi:hypothetical protein
MLGSRIIEDPNMVEPVGEDWSGVRSPARARRRRKHPQNIKIIYAPKKECVSIDNGRVLVMHPAMAAELRAHVRSRAAPKS